MTESLLTTLIDQASQLSGWEVIAAALGIVYVVLAARESVWCWPAAFASTLIYSALFWHSQLPLQALLNLFYLFMAVYGWLSWRKHSNPQNDLKISNRPGRFHVLFVASGLLLTYLSANYLPLPPSQMPYLDAFVMVFSVMTTVLMARKILENWLYWMIIDSAAIMLYWQTGFYVTIVMFLLYLGLAVKGYQHWRAHMPVHNR